MKDEMDSKHKIYKNTRTYFIRKFEFYVYNNSYNLNLG